MNLETKIICETGQKWAQFGPNYFLGYNYHKVLLDIIIKQRHLIILSQKGPKTPRFGPFWAHFYQFWARTFCLHESGFVP